MKYFLLFTFLLGFTLKGQDCVPQTLCYLSGEHNTVAQWAAALHTDSTGTDPAAISVAWNKLMAGKHKKLVAIYIVDGSKNDQLAAFRRSVTYFDEAPRPNVEYLWIGVEYGGWHAAVCQFTDHGVILSSRGNFGQWVISQSMPLNIFFLHTLAVLKIDIN